VLSNQYGLAGRKARNWGPDTIDGDLDENQLRQNRNDQNTDNEQNHFRDDPYYASKEYNMDDIKVPLLTVGNWGGILLHLRGNVEGYTGAGSNFKYLRFVTGRHDLPFYYEHEVEVQRSFLDAFLRGDDRIGWSVPGKLPPIDLVLRRGDFGHNNPDGERKFSRRSEAAWPIPRTHYTQYHLTPDKKLATKVPTEKVTSKISYAAHGTLENPQLVQFATGPVEAETEITGHVVAHLCVSMNGRAGKSLPSDIDLFLTLRHISPEGKEVFYTGTAGDPVPLCKGWLRMSLRKVNTEHPRHRSWLPYRDYFSTDVLPVLPGEVYPVDVEIWPTNVVLEKGAKLVLEVASGDTQGSGVFKHTSKVDR
jgi:predicted acyl esterase